MDFMEQLAEKIDEFTDPLEISLGYLGAGESFVIYPLPGSQIVKTYMNGATDQRLNYEIAMKSKSQRTIHQTLWLVQNELEQLQELKSEDGSFQFQEIKITDKPFIQNADEQGWLVFLLNIKAEITVLKREGK